MGAEQSDVSVGERPIGAGEVEIVVDERLFGEAVNAPRSAAATASTLMEDEGAPTRRIASAMTAAMRWRASASIHANSTRIAGKRTANEWRSPRTTNHPGITATMS